MITYYGDDKKMLLKPDITQSEIELIEKLIAKNPSWGRTRLSVELCKIWNWCHPDGSPKEISCRDMLRKLDSKGLIRLPEKIRNTGPKPGRKKSIQLSLKLAPTRIEADIKKILPIRVQTVKDRSYKGKEFKFLVNRYHYLGFGQSVGENLKYMAYDRYSRPLACLLFGSAAWSCAPRDAFIGWDASQRKANLIYTTNNMRYLILPWVKVPHLASHILGKVARRIGPDWEAKYGHPIYLLETFVECARFAGTCYKASNWTRVGSTKGRGRNDRSHSIKVPVKDIYLYPLTKTFRKALTS